MFFFSFSVCSRLFFHTLQRRTVVYCDYGGSLLGSLVDVSTKVSKKTSNSVRSLTRGKTVFGLALPAKPGTHAISDSK